MRVMSLMCSKSRAACRLTEAVFAWAVWHVSDHNSSVLCLHGQSFLSDPYGQMARTSESARIYDGSEKLPLGVCAGSN